MDSNDKERIGESADELKKMVSSPRVTLTLTLALSVHMTLTLSGHMTLTLALSGHMTLLSSRSAAPRGRAEGRRHPGLR